MRNFDAVVFPFDKYFLTFVIKKLSLKLRCSSWESFYKNFTEKNTTLEVTFLFQKLENICQKEKRRHRNFASELSGCKKIVNFLKIKKYS